MNRPPDTVIAQALATLYAAIHNMRRSDHLYVLIDSLRNSILDVNDIEPLLDSIPPGPYLPIAETDWKTAGPENDPRAILRFTAHFNQLPMHIEAHAVRERPGVEGADEESPGEVLQRADAYDADFAKLHQGFNADASFMTTTIQGRDYVVFASPHCV